MPDIDSNGVDILDRFLAFKYRFMQFSVTEDVFNQVVDYIKELRKERDEARKEVCECKCSPPKTPFFGAPQELAEVNGWDCFKEDRK